MEKVYFTASEMDRIESFFDNGDLIIKPLDYCPNRYDIDDLVTHAGDTEKGMKDICILLMWFDKFCIRTERNAVARKSVKTFLNSHVEIIDDSLQDRQPAEKNAVNEKEDMMQILRNFIKE